VNFRHFTPLNNLEPDIVNQEKISTSFRLRLRYGLRPVLMLTTLAGAVYPERLLGVRVSYCVLGLRPAGRVNTLALAILFAT